MIISASKMLMIHEYVMNRSLGNPSNSSPNAARAMPMMA